MSWSLVGVKGLTCLFFFLINGSCVNIECRVTYLWPLVLASYRKDPQIVCFISYLVTKLPSLMCG